MSNVVPTQQTRDIAHQMVRHASRDTGYDAAAKYFDKVHPDQVPALVAVLLCYVKATKRPGRRPKPLQFTEQERLYGNARYKQGARDPQTVAQWREYQRVCQQRRRDREGRATG